MTDKVQRDMFSRRLCIYSSDQCAPPGNKNQTLFFNRNGSLSLCALKGSLTVEASLVLPFFLTILLAFFSFFFYYASAAQLKADAAADAKKMGVIIGAAVNTERPEITIYKTSKTESYGMSLFGQDRRIVQKAVCRGWIGFTEAEITETFVYITPEGSVYHLYNDCTHLDLSVAYVSIEKAKAAKNSYGEAYRKCTLCKAPFGAMTYITSEGNCYHSQRDCGGLKRTVRQVPISEAAERECCLRCLKRGGGE